MAYEFLNPDVLLAFSVCAFAGLTTLLGAFSIIRAQEPNPRLLAFGLAFAGGAMVYISLVEVFVKSLAAYSDIMADKQAYSYASISFFVGVLLVIALDRFLPNPHNHLTKKDVVKKAGGKTEQDNIKRLGILAAIAITAHNFPEGMATFFSTLDDPVMGSSLAFAIAVHNIPEGVSIAIPVYYATRDKKLTFLACLLSGLAEPVGALLGYLFLAPFLTPMVYGAVFGIIAGVMVFLALDELLPTAKRYAKGHDAVYGMITGMAVIALSLVMFR